MVTLSTTNWQHLEKGVAHLVASFRRLRQTTYWKKYVSGGATIIEIKGEKGNFHPHLHVLVYARWLDFWQLQPLWKKASGGIGCYILPMPKKAAMYYVTKYVTKSEAPEGDLLEISKCIKKYRLFQRFGSWQGYKIPKLKSPFPCEECKNMVWLTEWEIRKFEGSFRKGG